MQELTMGMLSNIQCAGANKKSSSGGSNAAGTNYNDSNSAGTNYNENNNDVGSRWFTPGTLDFKCCGALDVGTFHLGELIPKSYPFPMPSAPNNYQGGPFQRDPLL